MPGLPGCFDLAGAIDPKNTASPVWADTAYRAAANAALLAHRGLVPQFRRPKPRAGRCPHTSPAANASRRGSGSWASTSSPPRSPQGGPRLCPPHQGRRSHVLAHRSRGWPRLIVLGLSTRKVATALFPSAWPAAEPGHRHKACRIARVR
jgi:hypothetical protein